jgi:transposase
VKNTLVRKLSQVPKEYLVVGIDPHKEKHAAVAITQDFSVITKFKFDNTRSGLESMLDRVREAMVKANCRGSMFAIETGGHYWRNMAYFLDERGLPLRLINTFTLKRLREGKDLNRRKNDYRDSEVAAQLLCTGEFTDSKLLHGVYADLRATHNAYDRLVRERTRLSNLLKGLLDGLFPEFTRVFKDPCRLTSLTVLSTCAIPDIISSMAEEKFIAMVKATGRPQLRKDKLRAIHRAAKTSIGIVTGARPIASELSLLVEKLELIKRHIGIIEQSLVRLVDQTEEGKYLLSIRGLNYLTVAGMLAELGPFRAYQNARQMIKMAGTNPIESESAGKKRSRTPMSKKGRPGLRYCAWIAVIPLLRFNPDFRAWAKRLRERPAHANPLNGKTYYQAPQLDPVSG